MSCLQATSQFKAVALCCVLLPVDMYLAVLETLYIDTLDSFVLLAKGTPAKTEGDASHSSPDRDGSFDVP